jgi:hypothetical protein
MRGQLLMCETPIRSAMCDECNPFPSSKSLPHILCFSPSSPKFLDRDPGHYRGHQAERNFTFRSACRMLVTTKQIDKHGWRDGLEIVEGRRSHGVNYGTRNAPSKVKVFLSRLAQCSFPTTDVVHHRNMSITFCCAICGGEDSWTHSLTLCTMTRCVWALSDLELVDQMLSSAELDVRNWIFSMIEVLTHVEFTKRL